MGLVGAQVIGADLNLFIPLAMASKAPVVREAVPGIYPRAGSLRRMLRKCSAQRQTGRKAQSSTVAAAELATASPSLVNTNQY